MNRRPLTPLSGPLYYVVETSGISITGKSGRGIGNSELEVHVVGPNGLHWLDEVCQLTGKRVQERVAELRERARMLAEELNCG